MNVLSLFDGISCGQLALNRCGIKYDNYFASEIDKNAIKVTQHHFPNTIQLGSVCDIDTSKLPKIDLLIGGSPCTNLSCAGNKLGIEVETLEQYLELKGKNHTFKGTSYLFWEYVRILKECKPTYFLLENVRMKKEYKDIITKYLGVEPIEINSSLLSAQNRKRLYWTNIPNVVQPDDKNIEYGKWLYRLGHGYIKDEIKFFNKYPCITAKNPGTKYKVVLDIDEANKYLNGGSIKQNRKNKSVFSEISPSEYEMLQTLPTNYTQNIKKTNRYCVVGNAWTVDVICHILKGII